MNAGRHGTSRAFIETIAGCMLVPCGIYGLFYVNTDQHFKNCALPAALDGPNRDCLTVLQVHITGKGSWTWQ